MVASDARAIRCLLVGIRGHGGEEVYSTLLRDHPPAGVAVSATFDFKASCRGARCAVAREVLLNRLVHPWAAPDMGFRALKVSDDVDLVHVHTHPTVLGGRRGRPVIFSTGSSHFHYLRDYEGWTLDAIRKRYARGRPAFRALGVLDSMLNPDPISIAYTFSENARAAYLDFGVPREKIRVLYPGFPVPSVPVRDGRDTVTYLFMGRDPRRKGGDLVLGAFARVRETLPNARLLYVSDVLPRPAPPGVETMPLVPAAAVASLYGRADVFLNPTRAEGFGFTNAEAQGFALPVISTRLGAIPEVVDDGRTGILIDPGDDAALVDAMTRLGREGSLRAGMGCAGREHFLTRFSLPVFQAGLRALYDEALAGVRR